MNIINPVDENSKLTSLEFNMNNSIFLAGPCPRKDYNDDWRFEAFKILEDLGFDGNVITPTNPNYNKLEADKALEAQTKWEYEAMHKASAIVFWIPRSIEHPARTTNIEFGDWYDKPSVFVGWPDDAIHNEYLDVRLKIAQRRRWYDLKEILTDTVDWLNRTNTKSQMFFTADTHFSQQRTLDLSQRPFLNIKEMDLTMISNWNKTVSMKDTIIHAGDFGDITTMKSVLSCLNFDELILVLGNYDRPLEKDIMAIIDELPDRKIGICVRPYHFDYNTTHYHVVHEPDTGIIDDLEYPEHFVLYGHIHGRAFAKENGIDIGTDYHNFTPVRIDKIEWFKNARQYWDNNVFCKKVKV